MGGTRGGAETEMLTTMKGWLSQWQFWLIIGLAVAAFIFFLWAVIVTIRYNRCKGAASVATTGGYRKRRQPYIPDPGIPASKLLFDTYAPANYAAAGYTAGMGQDPDVVLKNALQQ